MTTTTLTFLTEEERVKLARKRAGVCLFCGRAEHPKWKLPDRTVGYCGTFIDIDKTGSETL